MRPALVIGIVLALLVPRVADAAGPTYAGHETYNYNGNYAGIQGYLKQPTGSSDTTGFEGVWLGLCGHNDCSQWVQVGTYQGTFKCCTSGSSVHIYVENMDPCGVYYSQDFGAPASSDYFYSLLYDGTGGHNFTCPNGVLFRGLHL